MPTERQRYRPHTFARSIALINRVDFILEDATRASSTAIDWVEAPIERLPFPDGAFDTVVCTHVLEHVLDIQRAIAELRRIAAKRLIVVVPREREYLYTFNPHLHFFPYVHSFLRVIAPATPSFTCELIGRDIYYREDATAPEAEGG